MRFFYSRQCSSALSLDKRTDERRKDESLGSAFLLAVWRVQLCVVCRAECSLKASLLGNRASASPASDAFGVERSYGFVANPFFPRLARCHLANLAKTVSHFLKMCSSIISFVASNRGSRFLSDPQQASGACQRERRENGPCAVSTPMPFLLAQSRRRMLRRTFPLTLTSLLPGANPPPVHHRQYPG